MESATLPDRGQLRAGAVGAGQIVAAADEEAKQRQNTGGDQSGIWSDDDIDGLIQSSMFLLGIGGE